MKSKSVYISLVSMYLIFSASISAQDQYHKACQFLDTRGEVYFSFPAGREELKDLGRIISLDNIKNDTVYAYANRREFEAFLKKDIAFSVLTPPSLQTEKSLLRSGKVSKAWDVYPTYSEYVSMMSNFASLYPELCKLYQIGTSTNGRMMLCVKISDNVSTKEPEPEFFFSSTIHGDEVTGYMLTLRLIDHLLSNYHTDPYIKNLVDHVEIWINPNANPDGTYYMGNDNVSGAIRYNANFVDLNRNFSDPGDGLHPDGNDWQAETIAMMDFINNHRFVFSANFHGGAEVMNYPWDTWSRAHADESWFEYVSTRYADTVKKYGGNSYFSSVEEDGVINGYDWYPIAGGRQDYMTYFSRGREITIEVSNVKMPSAASQPSFWNYNYRAMLDYISRCMYGIHGIVTDSLSGVPLSAKITVLNHDQDNSQVFTDPTHGNYHRMIAPGTYNISCSAPGYITKTVQNIVVPDWDSQIPVDFQLVPNVIPVPVLVSPVNGSTDAATSIVFQWSTGKISDDSHVTVPMNISISDPDKSDEAPVILTYGLQISRSVNCLFADYEVSGLEDMSYEIEGLNRRTTYYWRVNATDGSDTSAWSAIWSFTTAGIVGLPDPEILSDKYFLGQNFPNPCRSETIIPFYIPAAGNVVFEIVNMNGQMVKSISGFYEEGEHEIRISPEDFKSGPYLYRMRTAGNIQFRYMLVR